MSEDEEQIKHMIDLLGNCTTLFEADKVCAMWIRWRISELDHERIQMILENRFRQQMNKE